METDLKLAAQTQKHTNNANRDIASSNERAAIATAKANEEVAKAQERATIAVAQEETKRSQEETKRDKTKVRLTMLVVLVIVGVTCVFVPDKDRFWVLDTCAIGAITAWSVTQALRESAKHMLGPGKP